MTDAEAAQIEAEFSLQIPAPWREFLTDPEACDRFGANNRTRTKGAPCVGMMVDYEDMRRENRRLRKSEYLRAYWKPEWLAIHADGCGNFYFVNTLSPTAVYELDHESTHPGYDPLKREKFPTMDDFLTHVAEYELKD